MSKHSDDRAASDPEPVVPNDRWPITRRRILQASAVAGGLVALGDTGLAQETQTIELGGEVSGWQGVAPSEIEGETNPTLELEAGTTYEVIWENLDGLPHNFVIVDDEGTELERTDLLSEQGATQTLEFEASSEMAEYYCEPHSATMRGEISVGDEAEDTEEETAGGEATPFFEPGVEIGLQTVADGMTAPTDFDAPSDGDERYYIADQPGQIWLVEGGERQSEPFLDISDRLVELGTFAGEYADPNQAYDERGLLGIEFHPSFAENGRFFVHYSAPPNDETPEGWSHVEVVSEFRADPPDSSQADPDSERVLMEFQKPQYNHDAGPMAFGPDGYLYVPMGDGGGANDDMEGHVEDWYDENAGGNGQDVSENLLGGVHRIDVDWVCEDRPYAIPEDNPLVDVEDALPEYYAWGLRNPFGISFDSEGRLFVSDAGQNLYEEANIVEAGGNYGWNVKEGTHCFSTESPSDPPEDCPDTAPDEPPYNGQELQDPIVEYPHVYQGQSVGITIIGGHVYESDLIPDLDGQYVFGDWTSDPAREEPAGRILAAAEPGSETAAGDEATTDTANGASDNATNEEPNNTTSDETADGTEDGGEQTNEVVPRDELWEMTELQIAGTEGGSFPYFVRQFGQDDEGNVFVLANREGVPEGDTGVVMEFVPPEEGEELSIPDASEDDQTGTDEQEPTNESTTNESETNETLDDAQDDIIEGNESDGNASTNDSALENSSE
ncbi:PQQ-dependent sugar dehydrogenase [Halostagnicola kamekurae]|nr:PQQ-dependent sugar dehydrogenase [Halostagnicola kamekurae]